jgi:uncharacterized membrane protein YgcG
VRRGSQSLFVPADVRVEEGAVQSPNRNIQMVFILRDGTRIVNLTSSIALSNVDRIAIVGSDPTKDVEATGVLALSRNGIVFPLELPTVTVTKGAPETKLMTIKAAGADVNVVQHLMDNRLHYSQAVFRALDSAMIAGLLSPFSITINGQQLPLVQVAEPIPVRIVGNALAFKINTDPINDAEFRQLMADRGLVIGQAKVDVVPLSSGGIFAEAVLGRFNCAEKLDLSRFFNWQDSPIPIQPPEIAAIQTGTRATVEDVKPGQLSAPIVNIQPPAALPDPTGLAATLTTLQQSNLFRDMSGLSETIKLATETAKLSAAGATAVGNQATEAMKIAVNADVEKKKIAADLAKAKLGKSVADKNITEAGAVVNKEEELKKKAAEAAKAAGGGGSTSGGSSSGGGSTSSGGGGGTNSGGAAKPPVSAPSTTGNSALDRIIGNDEALRSFIGLSSDSPEPTPPVTAEGVPLQEWDFFGGANLLIKKDGASEPEVVFGDDLKLLIEKDSFKVRFDDMNSMLLGDRRVSSNSLERLLMNLAFAPAGSVKTLNIVAHSTSVVSLDFFPEFIFNKDGELEDVKLPKNPGLTLNSVAMTELTNLLASPEISVIGVPIKLADVRRAFPVDGEVRVFNMGNPLQEEFIQLLANVFQVRTSGFAEKPVRVKATIIGEGEDEEFLLAKKIDLGSIGDPPSTEVDFFTNLLREDRAKTGLFTAFPRR